MSPVKRRKLLRQKLREIKDRPCMDCGVTFPSEQMTFDHVRGVKKFNLGDSLGRRTHKQVMEEVAKCEIVCRDCHDKREIARGRMNPPHPK